MNYAEVMLTAAEILRAAEIMKRQKTEKFKQLWVLCDGPCKIWYQEKVYPPPGMWFCAECSAEDITDDEK